MRLNRRVLRRISLIISAFIVLALTAFQAILIALVNSPDSYLRRATAPVLRRLQSPVLVQGWALFAPEPPHSNVHVFARARASNGQLSSWYDLSGYFISTMLHDRLTMSRALSEGLSHAATVYLSTNRQRRKMGVAIMTQTAAMLLQQETGRHDLIGIQIELVWTSIPPIGARQGAKATSSRAVLSWAAMPATDEL